MNIAIIGGGIAGMVAAYLLNEDHDITLFEANDYIGGHTHTVEVKQGGQGYSVDTGFIVFNDVTYPNFLTLIKRLGVAYQSSTMTFSVKCERTGLEYSPHSLGTFFAQGRNLFSVRFYRMIVDIIRFRREFDSLLAGSPDGRELVPFLVSRGYSQAFIDYFIIPLGSSLWSADPKMVRSFPLSMFVQFFKNHGFLETVHPIEWRVITGGSRQYVEKLTAPYAERIRLATPVRMIRRYPDRVELQLLEGKTERFDHVVIAVHSDQALAMIEDPSQAEEEILGSFPYQENLAVLHTDTRLLPRRRRIWSSWNYLIPREEQGRSSVTYDMNILQSIRAPVEFCVTLNREKALDKSKVLGQFIYHHPQYTPKAPVAQRRHAEISGVNRTHYCGAYWGYGFHEDGVNSALAACRFFGKRL